MNTVTVHRIEPRIQLVRGVKVIIDADLAELYGVPTKALNQAVKRNANRFPPDFWFQLTEAEKVEVVTNCDHLAKLKFSRTPPYAFTEHGAIQAANVLASSQAVEMGIYVVRAFVKLREAAIGHQDLAKRLEQPRPGARPERPRSARGAWAQCPCRRSESIRSSGCPRAPCRRCTRQRTPFWSGARPVRFAGFLCAPPHGSHCSVPCR